MTTKKAKPKPDHQRIKRGAPAEELYSVTRLAEYFELDRATMRKRLDEAGVEPVVDQANKRLYRLEDAEAAMEQEGDLEEIKLRKLTAEASLKELELGREKGELLPRKEVEDYVQKLFTALYQRLAVKLPREIGPQLFKAESTAQLTKDLQTNLETIFHEIRTDHRRLLGSD